MSQRTFSREFFCLSCITITQKMGFQLASLFNQCAAGVLSPALCELLWAYGAEQEWDVRAARLAGRCRVDTVGSKPGSLR